MFKSFRVGSVLGIPVKLDVTFLLILPIFAYVIGAQVDLLVSFMGPIVPGGLEAEALAGGYRPWVMGLAAALGLFLCVGLHELGHAVAALRYDYHIDSITLWLFGGIAALTDMPRTWRHEFVIAIAGPIVSVALGVAAYAPVAVLELPTVVAFLLAYLAIMNVGLAVFNLLPAFPLDGGRVLRALLTRRRSLTRATKLASEIGKGCAVLLGLGGLVVFNPILVGIAVFIYLAAAAESKRVLLEATLDGVRVADVMTPIDELRLVEPRTSVAEVLRRMVTERHVGYPVVRDGRPVGLVTPKDATAVDRFEREALEVRDVMSADLATIAPGAAAMDALGRMRSDGLDELLVVDAAGDLAGMVTRRALVRAFELGETGGAWDTATYRPEAYRRGA